jgi:hypothetical protein
MFFKSKSSAVNAWHPIRDFIIWKFNGVAVTTAKAQIPPLGVCVWLLPCDGAKVKGSAIA